MEKVTLSIEMCAADQGLGRYTTSTPIGDIDALRFQSSSIGLRVPDASDV